MKPNPYMVELNRLRATGTRSASTFLRGDGTWAAASGGGLADGDYGDITVASSGTAMTIDNDAVTFAKMQNVAATCVLGNPTGSIGNASEITCPNSITFSGTTLILVNDELTPGNAKYYGTSTAGTKGYHFVTDALEGYTYLLKSANQDITNAAVQNVTDLTFSTEAGATYLVEFTIAYSGSDSGADSGFDFAVDAGTMKGQGTAQGLAAGLTAANTTVIANAAANTNQVALGNRADAASMFSCHGSFCFSATNATTFRLRWGNNVATPSAISRLWKGTVIRYKKIS
jgi:hypothetical protein